MLEAAARYATMITRTAPTITNPAPESSSQERSLSRCQPAEANAQHADDARPADRI